MARSARPEAWEDDYQHQDCFTDAASMKEYLNYVINPDIDLIIKIEKVPAGTPAYLVRLYKYPVLTRHAEKMLFTKMNYAKFRAANTRNEKTRTKYIGIAGGVRNFIAEHNLRLVVFTVKKLRIIDFDAAVSDGVSNPREYGMSARLFEPFSFSPDWP